MGAGDAMKGDIATADVVIIGAGEYNQLAVQCLLPSCPVY